MAAGRCRCGAITVELVSVDDAFFCHCAICRRAGGAPVMAWAVGHLKVKGKPTWYEAEEEAQAFCARCGTVVFARVDGQTRVALGILDDPSAIRPRAHLHVEQQVPWLKIWDGALRVEGGEPPELGKHGWHKARDPAITAASTVSLRPIDAKNLVQVASLHVTGPQMRFVAPNALSLAQQAWAEGPTWLRAVYADETAVGLALVDFPAEDALGLPLAGAPFLWRFMVDEHHQGLGFGQRAMALLVDAMRDLGHDRLFVSAVPGTHSPVPFYERIGFTDTGVSDAGEQVYLLELSAP